VAEGLSYNDITLAHCHPPPFPPNSDTCANHQAIPKFRRAAPFLQDDILDSHKSVPSGNSAWSRKRVLGVQGDRPPAPRDSACAVPLAVFRSLFTQVQLYRHIVRRSLHKRACDVCVCVFGGGCKLRVVVSSMFSRTLALCMMLPIDPEHPSIDDLGLKSCGNAGSWCACPRRMRYCRCCNAHRAYGPCSHAGPSLNKLREVSGQPRDHRRVGGRIEDRRCIEHTHTQGREEEEEEDEEEEEMCRISELQG